jgi:hypothetical protein
MKSSKAKIKRLAELYEREKALDIDDDKRCSWCVRRRKNVFL